LKLQEDDKEEEEVDKLVVKNPPPSFEQHLKILREVSGLAGLKLFKYESRTKDEQNFLKRH
jgi:hypothetical protein